MDALLLGTILMHCTLSVLGIIANSLLFFLLVKKTPKYLTTYSMVILNFAVCDLLTCISTIFVLQRIVADGYGLYYVAYGPCIFFEPIVCFVGTSFMLHCYAHSLWSLLFSFSYRYYILGNSVPKTRTVIIIIALIYSPSAFQFVSFSFASDSVDAVKRTISVKFDYDMGYGSISGILNIMSWKPLFAVLHMSLPIIPAYIAILILRRATMLKLNSIRNMSDHCRQMHTNLLKALTYHACLPIFYLIAVVGYWMGQLDIYHHPVFEFSIVMAAIIPMLSPLTSFRFVGPYREWIRDTLLRQH